MNMNEIDHLIELRGVYDGWSIAVYTDGTMRNRWAADDGGAIPGYERRFNATEKAIAELLDPPEKVEDDEEFCPTCCAGVQSSEHHEKCADDIGDELMRRALSTWGQA